MLSEDFIGKVVEVSIDRKLGSVHPKHSHIIYEVNYGYLPDTESGDGEELDAYVLGIHEPLDSFRGKCIAVVRRKVEQDDKLIVVPENITFSDEEIRKQIDFQEKFFESIILR